MANDSKRIEKELRQRWELFVESNFFEDVGKPTIIDEIVRRYGAPGRLYHSGKRILDLLQKLQDLPAELMRPNDPSWRTNIELALWDHAVIYNARHTDNQEQSGERAFEHARMLGCPEKVAARVRMLVCSTTHSTTLLDLDAQVVCDLDLSWLAAPWESFSKDTRNLREESRHAVPDEAQYARNKRLFCSSLLERHSMYHTQYFKQKYEAAARANLRRALAN
jgi:predicted metal-dependent HD superfamily phosphohydrolase